MSEARLSSLLNVLKVVKEMKTICENNKENAKTGKKS